MKKFLANQIKGNLFLLIIFLLATLSTFLIFFTRMEIYPIRSDGMGYYAYLPAIFIQKDLTMKEVIDERYPAHDAPEGWGGIRLYEDDVYLDKYPMGVAMMSFPFFVFAHIITMIAGLPANGWSHIYQVVVASGGIFYMILGLFFMKKFLDKHLSKPVVYLTLTAITLGTNLFHYGTYDSLFSHVFSFCIMAAILNLIPEFYKKVTWQNALLLGLLSGLVIILRPTNIIFLIFIPLFGLVSFIDVKNRFKFYFNNWKKIILIVFAIFLVTLPQLLYWHYITGRFLVFSYGDNEYFNFTKPEILNVLFSARKGLFFWSPILLLSLPGIYLMKDKFKKFLIPTILYLLLHTYIVSCWWVWSYGGGYGHRTFVESLVVFALPLSLSLNWLYKKSKGFTYVLLLTFCTLQLIQMCQLWLNIIPPDGVTWEMYKDEIFLRFPKDKIDMNIITINDIKNFR